ncbi:GTP cyclohydrolase I FolE [Diaminobutyricibacter tongyongensis]|uniref:GTP cyclohydrolase 1 n=1 Tax=Leifsonia tongyongensis TaxID=1268043 RepID=A0A6L9XTA9_9MICO|nr:GTP cyclohydrolase I FolE [Diaminobutyricibacter tongyongensis]NEN04640.1 GTP cyclohydrolase I FolE [Diaminobutyricibacter tongyongensis]
MTGIDRPRIEAAVAEILAAIGEDPSRPGLLSTPSRVADAYEEFFSGLGQDPAQELGEGVPLEGHDAETVLLRDIAFRSVCEHHLLPFIGVAHVAYLPNERVVGLGRIPRVVETLASRPQLQERLTEEIADALQDGLGARGVLVVLDAQHQCVSARGVRQTESTTVTVASRGELADPVARAGLMALIGRGVA